MSAAGIDLGPRSEYDACAMTISKRDIRNLWGRAGGRCSICDRDVTKTVPDAAHIVARQPDGPRGDADLPPEQRDEYDNLILVCTNCHRLIDVAEPEKWPTERLKQVKADREERIRSAGQEVTEFTGEIIVRASGVDDATGLRTKGPTRIKPGTHVEVDATDTRRVTGVDIGGDE